MSTRRDTDNEATLTHQTPGIRVLDEKFPMFGQINILENILQMDFRNLKDGLINCFDPFREYLLVKNPVYCFGIEGYNKCISIIFRIYFCSEFPPPPKIIVPYELTK